MKGWCTIPRQKKDSEGNVIPSAPKPPAEVLDTLVGRVANFALLHQIPHTQVTHLLTQKFSTEQENVRREQIRQIAEKMTPEQLTQLLSQLEKAA